MPRADSRDLIPGTRLIYEFWIRMLGDRHRLKYATLPNNASTASERAETNRVISLLPADHRTRQKQQDHKGTLKQTSQRHTIPTGS